MQAEIVGVSFAIEPGHAAYVPLAHDYPGAPEQLDRASGARAAASRCSRTGNRGKLGQHLKYDMHVLRNHGIELRGMRYDTMLESYVLNSTATRHDMDSVAQRYLGLETIHYEDVAGKGAKQIAFNEVPVEHGGRVRGRGRRRHAAAASHAVAAARSRAGAGAALHRASSSRWCRCCSRWSTAAC